MYSRRCTLAFASAMRIMDSMWRTVIGTLPVALKSRWNHINVVHVLLVQPLSAAETFYSLKPDKNQFWLFWNSSLQINIPSLFPSVK